MKPADAFLIKQNYRYFTLGWAALIFIISTIPYLPQPETATNEGYGLRFDYLFHFVVYLILGSLLVTWQTTRDISIPLKKYLAIMLLGIAFGLADEWHQVLIPGRTFNLVDFYLNTVGFLSGFLFTYHYLFRHLMLHRKKFPHLRKKLFGGSQDQLRSPKK